MDSLPHRAVCLVQVLPQPVRLVPEAWAVLVVASAEVRDPVQVPAQVLVDVAPAAVREPVVAQVVGVAEQAQVADAAGQAQVADAAERAQAVVGSAVGLVADLGLVVAVAVAVLAQVAPMASLAEVAGNGYAQTTIRHWATG